MSEKISQVKNQQKGNVLPADWQGVSTTNDKYQSMPSCDTLAQYRNFSQWTK